MSDLIGEIDEVAGDVRARQVDAHVLDELDRLREKVRLLEQERDPFELLDSVTAALAALAQDGVRADAKVELAIEKLRGAVGIAHAGMWAPTFPAHRAGLDAAADRLVEWLENEHPLTERDDDNVIRRSGFLFCASALLTAYREAAAKALSPLLERHPPPPKLWSAPTRLSGAGVVVSDQLAAEALSLLLIQGGMRGTTRAEFILRAVRYAFWEADIPFAVKDLPSGGAGNMLAP